MLASRFRAKRESIVLEKHFILNFTENITKFGLYMRYGNVAHGCF